MSDQGKRENLEIRRGKEKDIHREKEQNSGKTGVRERGWLENRKPSQKKRRKVRVRRKESVEKKQTRRRGRKRMGKREKLFLI